MTALRGDRAGAYLERQLGWALGELAAFPRFILLETVNGCNSRCTMCGIDFSLKQTTTMADGLFAGIVREIAAHAAQVEKVTLTLDGEPLLDRALADRVRMLKEAGIGRVHISSNASILTAARARELIAAGLDEIYISIDSLDRETYEAIRVGLDFEAVMENTHRLIRIRDDLQANLMVRVQMIRQESNLAEEQAFIRYWRDHLSVRDQVVVQKVHNWASSVTVMRVGDEERINDVPCIALWGTAAIEVDGRVRLCCMDTTCRHPLGDLDRQTLAAIWTGTRLAAFRAIHLSVRRHTLPICDGCTLWRESKRDVLRPDEGG